MWVLPDCVGHYSACLLSQQMKLGECLVVLQWATAHSIHSLRLMFVYLIWLCQHAMIMATCVCDTDTHIRKLLGGKTNRVSPNFPSIFLVFKRTFCFWWCEHLNFVPGLWMCSRKCMSAVYSILVFNEMGLVVYSSCYMINANLVVWWLVQS